MTRKLVPIGAFVALAAAQSASAQLAINWQTFDSGGNVAQNGTLQARCTLGQPDASVASGGTLTLHGGFWFGVPEPAPCYVDCDQSNTLDFFDFLCFQNAFTANDPYADCDGSTVLDFFDFLCFVNAFNNGCP